jgi:hypothetical protein
MGGARRGGQRLLEARGHVGLAGATQVDGDLQAVLAAGGEGVRPAAFPGAPGRPGLGRPGFRRPGFRQHGFGQHGAARDRFGEIGAVLNPVADHPEPGKVDPGSCSAR